MSSEHRPPTTGLLGVRPGVLLGVVLHLGGGRMFRAYDKSTGRVLWQTELAAGTSGAPMTYLHDGTQYVVVATSERDRDGELVAFAVQ